MGKGGTDINVCCMFYNSVRQDSKTDPFGWQPMVALLGLWMLAGMERCETLRIKDKQTCSISRM